MNKKMFDVVATTEIGVVGGKRKWLCLDASRYTARYGEYGDDGWLPTHQPKADPCVVTTLVTLRTATFIEQATSILGIDASSNVKRIGKLLKKSWYVMTLPQVEEMAKTMERDGKTNLRPSHENRVRIHFFVKATDKDDPVSIGNIWRDRHGLSIGLSLLNRSDDWSAGCHLLVPNLDVSRI